jgi:1-acyl-sn-glycerol-3-phosphate acyltransferase
MGQIRAALIFAGFVAGVMVYVPAQAAVALLMPAHARVPGQIFFKYFTAIAGITVIAEGAPLDSTETGGYLLVSNHVSYFDVAALGPQHPMAFVAKSEVAGWPVIGWLAGLAGTLFVNRKSRIASAKDKRAIRARLDRGEAIVLFPEGTSSDGQRVLPFKSALLGAVDEEGEGGAARDIWVQPVTLTYKASRGLPLSRRNRPFYAWYGDMDFIPHKWGAYVAGPFEIRVRFHPPVRRGDFASRKALAQWCEGVIRAGLEHDLAGRTGAPALPERPLRPETAVPEGVAAE